MITKFSLFLLVLYSTSLMAAPVWTNQQAGGDDYIVGTIHMGDERLVVLPKKLKKMVDEVDVLVVEVDITAISQSSITTVLNQYAMLPEGQSLQDVLSINTYFKLQKFSIENDLSLQMLNRYQPWFVSINLAQAAYEQQGFDAKYGVDSLLIDYAKSIGKTIVELESFEQQFALLHTLFGDTQRQHASAIVDDTLNELMQYQSMPKQMLDAWFAGDMNAFESIYKLTMNNDDFDQFYEQNLIINRNKSWTKKLLTMFKQQSVLVAVGTLHLAGPHAIQNNVSNTFEQIR